MHKLPVKWLPENSKSSSWSQCLSDRRERGVALANSKLAKCQSRICRSREDRYTSLQPNLQRIRGAAWIEFTAADNSEHETWTWTRTGQKSEHEHEHKTQRNTEEKHKVYTWGESFPVHVVCLRSLSVVFAAAHIPFRQKKLY